MLFSSRNVRIIPDKLIEELMTIKTKIENTTAGRRRKKRSQNSSARRVAKISIRRERAVQEEE
jgi:hypothetical protein